MKRHCLYALILFIALAATAEQALSQVQLRKGQTVYVPAYSHVYITDRAYPFNLAVTLVIRNTDPRNAITVTAVEYYDDHGKLVRRFINKPRTLGPMASTSFFIKESDTSGGIGANFIVRWNAEREVNAPIIESVMIGGRSGQGISFTSPGQEIRD
ncbi:MAG: DUF3124 domain-containing protein [Nitrospirota bacterium]